MHHITQAHHCYSRFCPQSLCKVVRGRELQLSVAALDATKILLLVCLIVCKMQRVMVTHTDFTYCTLQHKHAVETSRMGLDCVARLPEPALGACLE